ncbi:MAG: winged helix-turn-helix transcriptional regulator [Nanoarchaeota archaeon]
MLQEYLSEKNKKILELETRRKIYELVKKYSGCHFRELERKSNLPTGVLQYHLNYLTKNELIKQEKVGNNICYFLNVLSENWKLLSLLRQKNIRKIILFILTNKNHYHLDIVRFTNLSPSTVSWHLNKLIKNGIIAQAKEGRKTNYKLLIDEKEIIRLLISYKESFFDSLVNKTIEMWEIK